MVKVILVLTLLFFSSLAFVVGYGKGLEESKAANDSIYRAYLHHEEAVDRALSEIQKQIEY